MTRMDALSLCHGSVVEVGIINESVILEVYFKHYDALNSHAMNYAFPSMDDALRFLDYLNEDIANYTIFEVRALSGSLHSIVDERLTKAGDE